MISYVYVVVRTDIPIAQQIVQVAHACLEAAWKYPRPEGEVYLCLQSVRNEQELFEAYERIQDKGFPATAYLFYEPDLPGYTALATKPIPQELPNRRAIFKFNLWSEADALNNNPRLACDVKHDETRNIKYITGEKP